MGILPLLADGSCSVTGTCLKTPQEVHGQCPQSRKCGTCVAWSPRKENGYGRNSGQCMLDRDSTQYLDCNAPICPYYKPRRESPAFLEWQQAPPVEQRQARRSARKKLDREAPPPSAAALAMAAFAEHPPEVAEMGSRVLEASLEAFGAMPVLLERFRGGTVALAPTASASSSDGPPERARETTVEAFFARIALLRRALDGLERELSSSTMAAEEREKVLKDLAGIGGSLTTFNFLFKDKDDYFRGQGGKG